MVVYKHTVPDGRVYIGIAKDVISRWNNGEGYKENKPFYKCILANGWDNIKHEILFSGLTEEQARKKEIELIVQHNSENPTKGFNRTHHCKTYVAPPVDKPTITRTAEPLMHCTEEQQNISVFRKIYEEYKLHEGVALALSLATNPHMLLSDYEMWELDNLSSELERKGYLLGYYWTSVLGKDEIPIMPPLAIHTYKEVKPGRYRIFDFYDSINHFAYYFCKQEQESSKGRC